MKTMNVIFFDLDNTLYDSEIYYTRAFKSISEFLEKEFKVEQESSFDFLYSNWKKTTSMYNQMFDDTGMITDTGVEYASKEISMNLDNDLVLHKKTKQN